ncbi:MULTISPECIES: M15 family metallopeptidase [unclassified Mycobacterium]|uniref:M15 family metallopeptidase n=1 Tax=unclassified Mycobacterium TaxID=2642494 RepID=UPI0029C8C819|nr:MULTISPECIES: M15 family metallopeptidase [unclassified Mycobacterium]
MRRWWRVGAALVAVLVAALAGCAPAPVRSTTSTTPAFNAVPVVSSDGATPLTIGGGAIDTWNGWLPDGRTFSPFDITIAPVARLDPLLLKAIQDATDAAHAQGVDMTLTSGWRSKGFQQRLFDDAVRQYGSVAVAQQFVASPEASKHVTGEAVDITGTGASEWLIRNGAQFGLCQIYANENWHFELAVDQDGRCPPLRPNAAG